MTFRIPCSRVSTSVCKEAGASKFFSMESPRLEFLGQKHGNKVEDCFAGTKMADFALQYKVGLFKVRQAAETENFGKLLEHDFDSLKQSGVRKSKLQVGSQKEYDSMQYVTTNCTCKYDYAGTRDHDLFKVLQHPGANAPTTWLHEHHSACHYESFNEVVANLYGPAGGVHWHSDANFLLSESTDVVSLSLLGFGVFCVQPNKNGPRDFFRQYGSASTKDADIWKSVLDKGLRTLVVLEPGD